MPTNSQTQTILNYRAIDIGYGRCKFTDARGGCDSFPSLAPRADFLSTGSHLITGRRTTEVWVDGAPYEVGPDTTLFTNEIPVLHGDYLDTPQYRALLYGALDVMQLECIDLLVTGLPVHQYHSHSHRLSELLTGIHTIRPGVCVEVRDVKIAVQPLGGLIAHTQDRGDWKRYKDRTYLVIDPGYFTFDWFVAKGLNELPGRSGSIPCGVSEYLTSIQHDLASDLGVYCPNLQRIDEGLREGRFRIWGDAVDLEPFRIRAEVCLERAVRALCNRVDIKEVDEIVVVGGGSDYFLPTLRRAFPGREILVAKDPAHANVRGFHLIGKLLTSKRSKPREME